MGSKEIYDYYILFPNHQEGLRLHRELKKVGIPCTLAPTPREASKCCGVSLLIQEEKHLEAAQEVIRRCQIKIDGFYKARRKKSTLWNKFC